MTATLRSVGVLKAPRSSKLPGDGEPAELGRALVAEDLHVHLGERRLRLEELAGERGHVVLDVVDADADVVEAVVGEERLGLLDHVAGDAAALVDEELEAALLRVGERAPTPRRRSSGRRASSPDTWVRSKAAIACVTSFMVIASPLLPKTCSKAFTYSGSVRTIFRIGSWSCEAHLHRIDEGVQRLVLEARGAAVPELGVEVGRVHDGGRVARAGELAP